MKVFFPVVHIEIPATVGVAETVSPIELFVLRAVLAGSDRLSDLRGLFGMPIRMTMHLVTGLVRRNLVLVDFGAGRLKVPQDIAEKVRRGEGREEVKGSGAAMTEHRIFRLSLNRCSGRLRPVRHLRFPSGDSMVFRPPTGWVEPDDLAQDTIVEALNGLLRREGLRVFDLDRSQMRPIAEGYLEAEARAVEWSDEAAVTLAFSETQRVTGSEVAYLEELLLTTKDVLPAIWARLKPEQLKGPGVRSRALRVLPTSLPQLAASSAKRAAEGLFSDELLRTLRHAALDAESAGPAKLLVGSEAVWDASVELIAATSRMVAILCPFLAGAPAMDMLSSLPAAADATVIHGIEATLTDDQNKIAIELSSLPGVNVMTNRGAGTHAKVVVQDGRRALVGSKNLLSSSRTSPLFDLGVVLEGDAVMGELLGSLRETAPSEFREGLKRVPDAPSGVRTYYRLPPSDGLPDTFRELLALVERDIGTPGPQLDCAEYAKAVEVWTAAAVSANRETFRATRGDLVTYLAKLIAALDGAGLAAAKVVRTEEHRPLLFDALETASHYVVVASHQLGGRAMGNLRGGILRAVERGIKVALLWGSAPPAEPSAPSSIETLIEELRNEVRGKAGQLIINDSPLGIHCKAVVVDGHVAIISSFEFLHFANSPRYRRHELGAWIASPQLAQAVTSALADHANSRDRTFALALREMVHR